MTNPFDRIENKILSEIAGKQVERDLFGEISPETEQPPAYLPFEKSIEEIIKLHNDPDFPIDAIDPKQPYASALLDTVRSGLGTEDVRFFTAVNSSLDRYHGVDGFLEYHGKIVTIDLKTSLSTDAKADLVVNVPATGLLPESEEFHKNVAELALRCVRKFKVLTRSN